jgi:antitoxin PrlF
MSKSTASSGCCKPDSQSCCRVESLIPIDERGQMVLPKELRERAGIKAGDKLALISFQKDGEVCCLTLMKADNLAEHVQNFLGPILGNLAK